MKCLSLITTVTAYNTSLMVHTEETGAPEKAQTIFGVVYHVLKLYLTCMKADSC